jgi:hypothetical protein
MDWKSVQEIICQARDFTVKDGVCTVMSDIIMPSGQSVVIYLRPEGDHLLVHDGGAAFTEVASHGLHVKSSASVRRMLKQTNYDLTDDGFVCAHHVPVNKAGLAISFVADASLRAANHLLAHAKPAPGERLDRRIQDALRLKVVNGRANFRFQGRNRQHKFDFGFAHGDQVVLVDAVTPDMTSVSSAIVKAMDVLQADGAKARPILVYDSADGWKSDMLNLLEISGGESVSVETVTSGALLAA